MLDGKTGRSLDFAQRQMTSHVSVAGTQHGGESRGLFLAAPFLARLLEMPVRTHGAQSALAINFFLQAAKRFFDRLAFL